MACAQEGGRRSNCRGAWHAPWGANAGQIVGAHGVRPGGADAVRPDGMNAANRAMRSAPVTSRANVGQIVGAHGMRPGGADAVRPYACTSGFDESTIFHFVAAR